MSTISRFGSQYTVSSPRSSELKKNLQDLVEGIIVEELQSSLDNIIREKGIIVAKPNVVDMGDRRLIHLKPGINSNDAVIVGSLPYTKNEKSWSLHFGSHRLLSTGEPSSPQDFITMDYANKHYELKKKQKQ